MERRLEQPDGAIDLAPVIRVGEGGTGRQYASNRAQLRDIGLEPGKRVRARCIHRSRRRRSGRRVRRRDLDGYQARG